MKIKLTIFLLLNMIIFIKSQAPTGSVGINTQFPAQLFHIDSNKDNTGFSPTTLQSANDVVITTSGNMGVGTINPSEKLELNSGTTYITGLKFSKLNSSSPVSTTAKYIGVDNNGNVVSYPNPKIGVFTENETSNSTTANFSVSGGDPYATVLNYSIIPNSSRSLPIISPTISTIYFINYTFSTDVISSTNGGVTTNTTSGGSYYECRLFIDGSPTTAAQTLREYESAGSLQFALNFITQLNTDVVHTFDLRILRVQNSGSETNITGVNMRNLSLTYGISELNFN